MEIPAHPTLTPEAFRETVRRFTGREIMAHAAAWDEAGEFPRALYGKPAEEIMTDLAAKQLGW